MTANLAIQIQERQRRRMLMRRHMYGMSQPKGTMPYVFNPAGKPWFKMMPSPSVDTALGTVMGWISLLPFMRRLTRREQRWRQ